MPEPQLQRACACGGACPKCQTEQPGPQHESLHTKRVESGDREQTEVPPIIYEVLRSPGQPIDLATRAFMEPRFGHDFSRVRVHTDVPATESARAVDAVAYAVGQDVVFGTRQYAPRTTEGRRLLAHELVHVVQQAAQPITTQPRLEVSERGDRFEQEANRVADAITAKGPLPGPESTRSSGTSRQMPLSVRGGSGPGEGRSDKPPSMEEPAPELPRMDDPAGAGPAQGGAVPMAVTAVDKITANIGPTGLNIAHVPPCGAQPAIQFTASPKSAAPVTWSIDPGSAAAVASGTALTPSTNTLTATLALGASQKGGVLDIKAENSQGGDMMPYHLASHPTAIASTSPMGDPTDTTLYGGVFNHQFTSHDGQASSLDQVAVGEKFPKLPTPEAATHTFDTPFGSATLKTGTLPNTPSASSGTWFLTSAGELGGNMDTVFTPKSAIDIGKHLASGSNPKPKNPLPAEFKVDQQFFWWCPHAPGGSRWEHVADTTQTQRLRLDSSGTGAEFVAIVNTKENAMPYDGPPDVVKTGVTKARADPATVAPSPAGGTANTVQISADAFPASRTLHFSIRGNARGCTINHATGELTIGAQTGKVKVRVANANGGANWDEVDVTIATPAAPAPAHAPPSPPPGPTPHSGGTSAPPAVEVSAP